MEAWVKCSLEKIIQFKNGLLRFSFHSGFHPPDLSLIIFNLSLFLFLFGQVSLGQ